jgi:hypothetical protein
MKALDLRNAISKQLAPDQAADAESRGKEFVARK